VFTSGFAESPLATHEVDVLPACEWWALSDTISASVAPPPHLLRQPEQHAFEALGELRQIIHPKPMP
jgi:hypothetical protein